MIEGGGDISVELLKDVAPAHIGLIGYGAIGCELDRWLRAGGHRTTLILREGSNAPTSANARIVRSAQDLLADPPAVVVEAAGQQAVRDLAPTLLASGVSVVIASTGALADDSLLATLKTAAARGGSKLIIPAGAAGGLDYIAALAGVENVTVRYTSRKPPAAWVAELDARGHAAESLTSEVVLFEGSAVAAARLYPRNLNTGLTIALAAGSATTTVRVVADPEAIRNTHEIEVRSALGSAQMCFSNHPAASNPKTSAVTAASLILAIRRFLAPVVL